MRARAALLGLPLLAALFAWTAVPGRGWTGVVLAALVTVLCLALAARPPRGWPLLTSLLLASALVVALCWGRDYTVGWFALIVLASWAALAEPLPRSLVVAGIAVASLVGHQVARAPDTGWLPWIAGTVFSTVACALARRQGVLLQDLREAQAGLTARAAEDERRRIAYELHDVVGHALTVTTLHLGAARLALREDPSEADAALAQAERAAQQSLADVRATVSLIRDAAAPAGPLPGFADIQDLVGSFRAAGTGIRFDVDGDVTALPAAQGLTLYRILQEALTNAARHAPGRAASVQISVNGAGTTLQVLNRGQVAPHPPAGSGLTSMRERAESVGGSLTAGPSDDGWRVKAVLP